MTIQLLHGDCLQILPTLVQSIDKKINFVLVDLPYGQTSCKWDSIIDLNQMWIELKKICTRGCVYAFFCTTKFGHKLIQSNEKWFRYDLVWKKSKTVGFLNAKRQPMRNHEMIYIFADSDDDLDNSKNIELREYAEKVKSYINKPLIQITRDIGNQGIKHFYSFKNTQFGLPSVSNYNKLIELYRIDKMEGFRSMDDLKNALDCVVYNPQKTKGKPYKTTRKSTDKSVYGEIKSNTTDNTTGDRHPTSILEFNNPVKSLHPTQKPVDLCEWLIKSYSKEGDTVLDFTMGSGSTAVACINTNRNFIGIEKDDDIYKVAHNRIH